MDVLLLFMIIYKYGCAGDPLSIEFSPNSFSPTGVGDCKVQTVFVQIVPEATGDDMSQWVGKIVSYHLWIARCAGCEIHQRNIFIAVGMVCRFMVSLKIRTVKSSIW